MEQLFDFSFFWNLFPIMFRYIDVTLGISLASLVLALLIAFVIAAAYYLNVPVLRQICGGWVSLFRGTPLLAQLFWICYGLPSMLPPICRRRCAARFLRSAKGRWKPALPAV